MILLLTAESPRNPEAHDRTFVMARQVTVAVDDHFVPTLSQVRVPCSGSASVRGLFAGRQG